MKYARFSLAVAAALLAANSFAAPAAFGPGRQPQQGQNPTARNGQDSNYGYDKTHKVTPAERAKWEATHKNDDNRKDDKRVADNRKDDKRNDTRKDDRKDDKRNDDRKDDKRNDDRKDDRNGQNTNYGYDKTHQVTPEERAKWEANHKNDNRQNNNGR